MSVLPSDARELFDHSARTYDRVNAVISLGLDARWRDWAARRGVVGPDAAVLDAFAGTGLVGLRAARLGADVTLADASPGMLAVATARARSRKTAVRVVEADLTADPLDVPGAPFDAVTMVFGARYLDDASRVMRRLSGLLGNRGTFVVVDFVEPEGGLLSHLAAAYFFHVLPRVAATLAGDRELYDRLVSTTRAMGRGDRLIAMVRDAGLEIVETRRMGFGLVLGIVGRKTG